jgi:Uma2 family endonuclease
MSVKNETTEDNVTALRQPIWTEEAYLEFERASDTKHEYYQGEIFAMEGVSQNHSLITGNAMASIHGQLRKRPAHMYTSAMRLKVLPVGFYTYPDIVVVTENSQFLDEEHDILLNPTLIIEVLSPSTETFDRGKKFQYYRTLDSLQEYVLISQDAHRIEHYVRQSDGTWLFSEAVGLEATLQLPSIQCSLSLTDVYEKVTLEAELPQISGDGE